MSTPKDRRLLQDLAKRVAEVAALPIMAERRNMWKRHNRLERVRPMILVFPEGAWRELLPARALACESEESRRMEWNLRHRLFYREDIPDDTVIENEWIVTKAFTTTGWGLEPKLIPSRQATGAHAFVPVINTPADLVKLRHPQVSYDERATQRRLEEAHELFDGILDVKLRGVRTVSFHMMNVYCGLRGHENVLMDMCANPSMLHDAMKFIEEGYHGLVRQWQDLDLLGLSLRFRGRFLLFWSLPEN